MAAAHAAPAAAALAPATRKHFLEKRFVEEIAERRVRRPVRPYVQALIRTGSQMAYLGYYGDPDSWESIGYTRSTAHRPAAGRRGPHHRDRAAAGVAQDAAARALRHGGGRLRRGGRASSPTASPRAGRRVLVVERGPHVDPRGFSDDEVDQYLRLYNEGALQLATDFGLQVLQGMCVGGGTTINNALCLPPPEQVLAEWEPRGLDRAALQATRSRCVREGLHVEKIRDTTTTIAAAGSSAPSTTSACPAASR